MTGSDCNTPETCGLEEKQTVLVFCLDLESGACLILNPSEGFLNLL